MSTEATYRQIRAMSFSGLKELMKSPYHYWYKYLNPNYVWDSDSTPSMILGNAVHTVALEPHRFEARYAVNPGLNGNSNAFKTWAEEQGDRIILSQKQHATAVGCYQAIMRNDTSAYLMEEAGVIEQTIKWVDPDTNMPCKGRLDKITKSGYIVDIKTTTDATPDEFAKTIYNQNYHIQAAMYYDGLMYGTGQIAEGFVFIAVETTEPFGCAVYYLDDDSLQLGRDQYQQGLRVYRECLDTNIWPGYPSEARSLRLPRWAFAKQSNAL